MTNNFETFAEAIDAIQLRLDEDKVVLVFGTVSTPPQDHWTQQMFNRGPVAYGQTVLGNFEILTRNGKSTRAWFHVVICRLDSGKYELVVL